MLWAFARENGVPGSHYISRVSLPPFLLLLLPRSQPNPQLQVEPKTALPIWSISISALLNLLLALINIGSTAAFNAFTGLTVAGFYTVFILSASVMLHKRLTTPASQILWGPFRLHRAGVPLTIIALAFSVVGWFFSFWPPTAAVTVTTFNWSLVVYLCTIVLAMVWWAVYARRIYTGPKIELGRI